ncbi:MAG: nitrous oxide-stimulated promoter family protein [Candidatus Methanomethylophilaceae archaeon]|nr:nitrous oxide-stimulated promoter family protein [Candidatus Methanomethylophilaceae archaeon]
MTSNTEQYISERKSSTESIISVYCRKNHSGTALCEDCRELRDYAFGRIDGCRNNDCRTRCKGCPTHCYNSEMDRRMNAVLDSCKLTMILHPGRYRRIYL